MKRVLVVLLMVAVVVSLAAAGCAKEAPAPAPAPAAPEYGPPAEVTEWVFQPCFGPSDAGWANGVVPWVEDVEAATEGTIKIELLPIGSIVGEEESLGACREGMLDVTACWAPCYSGDLPEGMLAYGLALGCQNWEEAWDVMWADPKYRIGDIVQKAANNVNLQWAGWADQGPNGQFTNFEVHKWEDYSGHKMRAGGPQAIFFNAVGGSAVQMPGGEILMSLKLGTIEGTFWDTGGTDDMHFYEETKYVIKPVWCPAQHQDTYINLDSWNALNQWQRDRIMYDVFMSNYFKTSRMHNEGVEAAIQTYLDHGGEIIRFSDEEVDRLLEKVAAEVWPAYAELSPGNAQGVEIYKQFLKDKGRL